MKGISIFCRFFASSVEGSENSTEKKLEEYGSKNPQVDKEIERNNEKEEKLDESKFSTSNELGSTSVTSPPNPVHPKTKSSPGSAFTWSKFKYSKTSNVTSSKTGKVNSDYKKVGSESCLSNYFSSKSRDVDSFVPSSTSQLKPVKSCDDIGDLEDSVSQSSYVQETLSQASSVSYSQESGAYSIDLECLPDSQEIQTISEEYVAQTESVSRQTKPIQVHVYTCNTLYIQCFIYRFLSLSNDKDFKQK